MTNSISRRLGQDWELTADGNRDTQQKRGIEASLVCLQTKSRRPKPSWSTDLRQTLRVSRRNPVGMLADERNSG